MGLDKVCLFHGCLPGMSNKIINWDLDSLSLQDVLKCLQHQIVVKRICGKQEKFNSTVENSVLLVRCAWRDTLVPAAYVW